MTKIDLLHQMRLEMDQYIPLPRRPLVSLVWPPIRDTTAATLIITAAHQSEMEHYDWQR